MAGVRGHRLDTLKTRRDAGGLSIGELARQATVSDETIIALENGGVCDPDVTQRLLDALAPNVGITSNSQANPSVVTTATAHRYQTGDTVTISGVVGSNADINGSRVATRISATTFSVPVNASVAGGTGGACVVDPVSVGLARL